MAAAKTLCKKRSTKAFLSYDALFSILPLVFMIAFILQVMAITITDSNQAMERREASNFLTATADYVVKVSPAVKADAAGNFMPNWIDESILQKLGQNISKSSGRDVLLTTDANKLPAGNCIYRLVVVGGSRPENGEIKKLYACD